jgi:hypothetical protein
MKGLIVNVYRAVDGRDCTNGGVSSKHSTLTAISHDPGTAVFEASSQAPAVYLGKWMGRVVAIPEDLPLRPSSSNFAGLEGWMFGGNFIYSSDSRFPGDGHPVPVFDRREF